MFEKNLRLEWSSERSHVFIGLHFTDSEALLCTGENEYCGVYRYYSGLSEYVCADSSGFDVTVLTTTTSSGAEPTIESTPEPTTAPTTTPFSPVAASSTSGSVPAGSSTVPAAPGPAKSMSGGAIAGTVVGSIVGIAAISLILLFIFQRLRKRKNRRQKKQTSGGPYHVQDQPLYDQYGKPVFSPLWSPQGHSRHQSDGQSELEGTTVSPNPHKSPLASPGISEVDGRALSPEPDSGSPPMNHGFSAGSGHQSRLAELPGAT
ncbi:hypothetical protein MMC07_009923 [Pseudocyphellaria aurata]|nr:hypothetical protein [Pseudocyphellaria aurata]